MCPQLDNLKEQREKWSQFPLLELEGKSSLKLVEILIIPIANPLLIGLYQKGKLVEKVVGREGEYTSRELPKLMEEILGRYHPIGFYYIRGPGSYMSIKLAYLFLKTLQIVYQIPFKGAEGFPFSENGVIKGIGNSCFIKKEGIIAIEKGLEPGRFQLPTQLDYSLFKEETTPLYFLKAV